MRKPKIRLLAFAITMTLTPFGLALAQSPELAYEPELLAAPSTLPGARSAMESAAAGSLDELKRAREEYLPRLQDTLARIDAKVSALKAADITYRYFIPMDRTRASQDLLKIASSLESAAGLKLGRCLRSVGVLAFQDYKSDYTLCRTEASLAWGTDEIQNSPRLQTLLEALVFRTRDELSRLQGYERELTLVRLAYATEIRQFGDQSANLEFELLGQNPAYRCNPDLGTIRLDEPSMIDGRTIPTSMKDVAVQDQGPLGTCYANAASVALETLTAKPNSALDLAIRFSMERTRDEKEISADFGGGFCGAIAIANRDGLCERRDSWIEQSLNSEGGNRAAAQLALQGLHRFIGRRSALPRSDWAIIEAAAPTLLPELKKLTEGQVLAAPESPMVRNLSSLISSWIRVRGLPKTTAEKTIRALRAYDAAHAAEYLPRESRYFSDRESAAAQLYAAHAKPMVEVLATAMPQFERAYLESQAEPFLTSGFFQMAGNPAQDKIRGTLEIRQSVQNLLQTQLLSCSSMDLAEQILLEVISFADLSWKAAPGSALSPVWLAQRLFSTSTKNVNEALLDAVAPRCQVAANRAPVKPVSCQSHTPRDVQFVEGKLLQNLSHGRPLGISYCADVLGQISGPVARNGRCAGHESLLTGIRYNPQTQRCDMQIWNSWGKATGKTWVDSHRLLPFLMGVQELSLAAGAR